MKMKQVLSVLVFCCASSGMIFGQTVEYPLHPGDQWEWYVPNVADTQRAISKIVGDSTFPNGKTYAVMQGALFAVPFQRQQGDSVYQYLTDLQKEVLFFDFTRSPGDTIAVFPRFSDTSVIVLIGKATYPVFGHNLRYWFFLVDNIKRAIDDEEFYTVIDSIGVARIDCFCADLPQLSGAIVNGVRYGTITGVKDADGVPGEYRLYQNYPNPFNPSTTIRFAIPEESHVVLKICNLLGQEVMTLLNEQRTAGVYDVNVDGSKLTSGVYFYRIVAGKFNQTKRMLVLK